MVSKDFTIPAKGDSPELFLKAGTQLFIPTAGFQMDPVYFPQPEKFDPERFSEGNKDTIVPYTYFPFGSGPRNCAGKFDLKSIKFSG